MNPFNDQNRFINNVKLYALMGIESAHNTFCHAIETVKVRAQARNVVTGDISHYFKNQVEKKPLISGVVSGFLGAAAGAFAFMTSFNLLTNAFYSNIYKGNSVCDAIKLWDFRYKNLLIYGVSDAAASCLKAPFEVRKQLIQMYSRDILAKDLAKLVSISWMPLMMRDVSFRMMMLSFYYLSTDIEQKSKLRFTVPQVVDIMKQRRAYTDMNGLPREHMHDLSHYFYEFHNYEIKTGVLMRLTSLVAANFMATLLTNPLDVCLSKMATQQKQIDVKTAKKYWKYTNIF